MPSPLEQWGRALEGFGAGYQGRTPRYIEEQRYKEEMDLRRQQLGIQQGQLDVSRGNLDTQRQAEGRLKQASEAQMALVRQGLAKGTVDMLDTLSKFGLDDDKAEALVPFAKRMVDFINQGSPDAEFDYSPVVRQILRGKVSAREVVDLYPRLNPAQRRSVLEVYRTDPVKAHGLAQQYRRDRDEDTKRGLLGKLQKGVEAGYGTAAPIEFGKAGKVFGLTDDEMEQFSGFDDQTLMRFNILPKPPQMEASRTKALSKAQTAGQLEAQREATPMAEWKFTERGIYRVQRDQKPVLVEDFNRLTQQQRLGLAKDLLSESRRAVEAGFPKDALGRIELGTVTPEQFQERVEEEFGKNLQRFGIGDVLAQATGTAKGSPAPKPSPTTKARPATRADIDAALKEAKGDKAKAREVLVKRGIDPSLPVKD